MENLNIKPNLDLLNSPIETFFCYEISLENLDENERFHNKKLSNKYKKYKEFKKFIKIKLKIYIRFLKLMIVK